MVDPEFAKACELLKLYSVKTLGYVYTDYGSRPIEVVRNRIELYYRIYGTDGILLDEMARQEGVEGYYSSITSFVKDLGMRNTVGNPGTSVAERYVKTVDTLIIYEKDGYPDPDKIKERTFYGKYRPEKFGLLLHSLSYYSTEWVKEATKFARYLYVTNAVPPNPYDPVSGYLDLLANDLSGK
jgi:hypothetical protein